MTVLTEELVKDPALTVNIRGESDLLRVRSVLRAEAKDAGLSLTAVTKLVTAGSELARNIVRYATASQGELTIERAVDGRRRGVRAVFSDNGPGIADVNQAMGDGFSTIDSLGLGLPGSKRLVDEFSIDSVFGRGTTVVIAQWSN